MATYDMTVNALVVRVVPSGDNDRLLTLLCPMEGRITVIAKGARSLRNKLMASCRPFVWGNFEIHVKGEGMWLRDASVITSFAALEKDIELLYLAQYISDVCCELSGAGEPAGELLQLVLNTYYALCNTDHDPRLLKAAFELRAATISGYLPEVCQCLRCEQKKSDAWYLDVMGGGIVCAQCIAAVPPPSELPENIPQVDAFGTRSIILPIPSGTLAAMRYVTSTPAKRLFSFGISTKTDYNDFCRAAETYLLNHLERGFSSLRLYHELADGK